MKPRQPQVDALALKIALLTADGAAAYSPKVAEPAYIFYAVYHFQNLKHTAYQQPYAAAISAEKTEFEEYVDSGAVFAPQVQLAPLASLYFERFKMGANESESAGFSSTVLAPSEDADADLQPPSTDRDALAQAFLDVYDARGSANYRNINYLGRALRMNGGLLEDVFEEFVRDAASQ